MTVPASETGRFSRALETIGRGARGFAGVLTLPETRDSQTLAASAKATYRNTSADAIFGQQAQQLKDTTDFLEAYADRAWVYACVRKIAKSGKVAPMIVEPKTKDAEPLESHPILDLFDSPNPITSPGLFIEGELTDLSLCGNFFAEVVYGSAASSVPLELYRMRPDRVEIVVDETGVIVGYLFLPGGTAKKVMLLPHEVWHRRYANPLDDYRGMPPLSAARDSVVFEYAAKAQINSYFANGLRFSGIVTGPENVSSDDLALIRRTLEGRHRGPLNGNKVAILPGQWAYTDMSGNPQDSDWINGLAVSRREVMAVYGISPPIAGDFSEGTTFSNVKEAREEFWQGTMTEHYAARAEDINHALLPRFGAAGVGVKVRFDLTDTPAFVDDRDTRFKTAIEAFNGGLITLSEARSEADDNLEQFANGDVRRRMINVEEIPADEPPPEEPDPAAEATPPDDGPPPTGDTPPEDGTQAVVIDQTRDAFGDLLNDVGLDLIRRAERQALEHLIVGDHHTHADYPAARRARTQPIVKKSAAAVVKTMATQRDDLMRWCESGGTRATPPPDGEPDQPNPYLTPSEIASLIRSFAWGPATDAFSKAMRATHLLAAEQAWQHSDSLGLGVTFDLNDPTVTQRLQSLQNRPNGISSIVGEQRQAVLDAVQEGMDAGASVQQIIRGGAVKQADGSTVDIAGIKGAYAPWAAKGQAYKAERVARTETGMAYNLSSLDSYRSGGIGQVNVYDGDSDEECAAANGQTWSIDEAEANPLEHPNCVRAFGPAT